MGQPEDVSRLVGWLCTDDAQWVVGQVINSEGGFRMYSYTASLAQVTYALLAGPSWSASQFRVVALVAFDIGGGVVPSASNPANIEEHPLPK